MAWQCQVALLHHGATAVATLRQCQHDQHDVWNNQLLYKLRHRNEEVVLNVVYIEVLCVAEVVIVVDANELTMTLPAVQAAVAQPLITTVTAAVAALVTAAAAVLGHLQGQHR